MGRRKKKWILLPWEEIKQALEKTRRHELEEARKILDSPSPLLLELIKGVKERGEKIKENE